MWYIRFIVNHHPEKLKNMYSVLVNRPMKDFVKRLQKEKMAELGVATNVHYKPLPMMSAYQSYGWNIGDFPNAYDYYHNLITLPLHTKLTNEDVDYVIDVFRYVVKDYFG